MKGETDMFILGMTIGVTGGTVFGVVLICCLIAGKRGDSQIEQMAYGEGREQRTQRRCIRFLDIEGKEIFRIFDGESIYLTAGDGANHVSICRYVDADHIEVDGKEWMILDFARRMHEIGISYAPFLGTERR